ncbi:MAG: response regulator [Nitrospirae bacterium]|nr:response regulator [Nitrospirota bacterium]
MKKDKSDDNRHRDLRQQAEEILKIKKADEIKYMHETDIRTLVHELQVHQIELEMQNEELQIARNKAEEMSEQYIDLFDFAPVGFFTFDEADGSIIMVNLSGASMLGVDRMGLIGRRFAQFITPEGRGVFNDFFRKTLNSDRKQTCEIQIMKDNAPSLYAYMEGIAVAKQTSKKEIRASLIDLTDHRQVDDDRVKIHKLESLGILAGGIAHDFNNLLTGILGNISLALMHINPEDKVFKWLVNAENASLRAQELTYKLLTFSKGGAPVKRAISITKLLRDSVDFVLSGSNVKIEFSIPDDIWAVNADETQISQVISNLTINAIQAMPDGGIIRAGCENLVLQEDNPLHLDEGNYVKITIKDSGNGIPEELLKKIFDPFFTTKENGKGLGLSICYSILKRHNGIITVESDNGAGGAGTTFSIYLPACFEKIEGEKEEGKTLTGIGRILLMDDEEIIIQTAPAMLKALGYEVEAAGDGAEAIEKYKLAEEMGKPFDAVIMDLTIPGGMGGKNTIKRLREINPVVRAIVSSGYSNDPIIAEYKEYGFMATLSKPFRMQELSEVLHRVLSN